MNRLCFCAITSSAAVICCHLTLALMAKEYPPENGSMARAFKTSSAVSQNTVLPSVSFGSSTASFSGGQSFTAKVRSKILYPSIKDARGIFTGAGFLIDRERGWIATNAHVTGRNPTQIEIKFEGSRFQPAGLIFVDQFLDFAVLELGASALPAGLIEAPMECHKRLSLGAPVAAFGYPYGLGLSGTRGVISARQYRWGRNWIQTDAAINKGNSGGPLIDISSGRVVGMNTAGLSDNESDGIGFAIPAPEICTIIDRLKRKQNANTPVLPVELSLNHEETIGLNVMQVYTDDIRWNLRDGDKIEKVLTPASDGSSDRELETPADFVNELRKLQTNAVKLLVRRGVAQSVVRVPLHRMRPVIGRKYLYFSGLVVGPRPLRDDGVNNPSRLFVVHDVRDESEGDIAGFKAFEFIKSVDGKRFSSIDALNSYLRSKRGALVRFNVYRRARSFHTNSVYSLRYLSVTEPGLIVNGLRQNDR